MKRTLGLIVLSVAALGTSGCVVHETRPQERVKLIQAASEIPQTQLLDVGVRLFDENLPEDEKEMEENHIFPEVRKAEARYLPMQLRNTLEGTGQWGQVRVMPGDADALDVYVSGKIIDSTGQVLRAEITVEDASGDDVIMCVFCIRAVEVPDIAPARKGEEVAR